MRTKKIISVSRIFLFGAHLVFFTMFSAGKKPVQKLLKKLGDFNFCARSRMELQNLKHLVPFQNIPTKTIQYG